jgi:hypothetical protein
MDMIQNVQTAQNLRDLRAPETPRFRDNIEFLEAKQEEFVLLIESAAYRRAIELVKKDQMRGNAVLVKELNTGKADAGDDPDLDRLVPNLEERLRETIAKHAPSAARTKDALPRCGPLVFPLRTLPTSSA